MRKLHRLTIFILLGTLPLLTACGTQLRNMDLSDAAVTARVKSHLKSRDDINVRYMDIHTHMRVVTLSGIVDSYEQKREIVALVRRVPGVRSVMINLVVEE